MKNIPEFLLTATNTQVLKYLAPLSCHGDIVEPLSKQLEKYSDAKWFCPDRADFKYCLWYLDDTVFAFAVGMKKISLKLPISRKKAAVSDGGVQCKSAGESWISFSYDTNKLEKWVKISYEYAKNS